MSTPTKVFTQPNSVMRTDPDEHWRTVYGGLKGLDQRLNPEETRVFTALDKISRDPEENRAQAINQAFVGDRLKMAPGLVRSNWSAVKSAFAKEQFDVNEGTVSDKSLYGWIGQRLNPPVPSNGNPEIKAWRWDDALAARVQDVGDGVKSFWQELWKPTMEVLPKAPDNLPDRWEFVDGIPINPAIYAGVWNGAIKPMVDSFSSPGGIATLGVGSALKNASESYRAAGVALKGMSGVFSGIMADAAIDSAEELRRLRANPNSTRQEQVTLLSSTASNGLLSALGVLHGAMESTPERAPKIAEDMQGKNPAEGAAVLRNEANQLPLDQKAPLITAADMLDQIHKASGQPELPLRVKAAAVLATDGTITEGASHEEIAEKGATGAEGFTLSNGEFVGRDAAYEVADEAGQLAAETPKGKKELQSHMLEMPAKNEAAKVEAQAIEAAPADEHLSSVKKASVNAQLVRMGFEPVTPSERQSWSEGVKGAMERFEKDPERGANLVRRALAGDRRFSTEDVWDSQVYERRLQDEITVAEKRYDEALKSGDQLAIDAADAELYDKQATLKQASQAFNEVMGSEAGRALNARNAMLRDDYSLAALERKYRKATASADIPEDVQKQLSEKADKIAELEESLRKSQEQRARRRPPSDPRVTVPRLSPSILARLSDKADEARERLSKRAGLSASVVGDEGAKRANLAADLQDYAVITADLIAKGVVKTAELSAKLISDFGEAIKPHVEEVIQLAKDNILSEKHADYLGRRVAQLESQIKKLSEKIANGDLATEGVKASRPSIEEIEKLEQKRDSKRDELAGMREQASKIEKLEKAISEKERQLEEGDVKAKGKPANRPAPEVQEKLTSERDELNKKIAEARKEASKPSQADRIADEVADIEQEIAEKRERLRTGNLAEKNGAMQNRPQVREIELAKQELEKVNAELAEARKGPPPSPESKRGRDLDRQIAELERQLRTEEVFSEDKTRPVESPELIEKQKRLAALKEERQNARDRLQPKDEPLSKEEAGLKAWRSRTEKEINRLEAGLPKPERSAVELPFTPEDIEKKKRLETLKREFALDLRKKEEARRPLWMKGADVVKWVGETSILTSLGIFLKIPVSAFWKTVTAPLKEAVGTAAGKIFPKAAKFADMQVQPTFASLLDTEGKAAKSTFTEGARAAGESIRNKLTTEETLFVPDSLPPEAKDFVRSIHKSLHIPAQINEFTRRVSTIENNLIAAGKGATLSDPAVWSTIRVRAWTEAYRAAFMEKDALLSGIVNATIRSIEQRGKKYNAENLAGLITMAIEMDNPIKTVPVNILSQTGESMAGSITGTIQILNAYRNGFEKMKPGELDAAFRRVKTGTVGAIAMLGGWYAYENIGGSRPAGPFNGSEDKKRKPDQPKEGQVKIGDAILPEMAFHNDTWAAAQMMASYHHLLDEQYGKATVAANADAFLRAALGQAEDVPGFKQGMVVTLAKTKEPTKTLAQWTAARTIPAGVAQIARWLDTPGDLSFETFVKKPTQRFTRDALDEFKTRIPGERETLPNTKAKRDRDIRQRLKK